VQTILAAFKYLTVWQLLGAAASPEIVGKSAPYFPLVGCILGLSLALLNYALTPHLALELVNLAAIALLIAATGGQHLAGLKEIFRGPAANSPGNGRTAGETLGVAAIILVILFKSAAANSMDEGLALNLVLVPVLARWALVIFFHGYGARFDDISRLVSERIRFWPMLASTAATLTVLVYLIGRRALWLALAVSIFSLCLRALLYRRHGELSQDDALASVELNETLALILLASL
jgi:adenosylcobinamide-GDP ribazoletransferase